MITRLVDPIHLFDHTGTSVLTREHLEAEIVRLGKENKRMRSQLNKIATKIRKAKEAKAAKS